MKESRDKLKKYFQTGDQPTEQEFANWFDSSIMSSGSNAITGSLIISGSTSDNADGSAVSLRVFGDVIANQYVVSSSVTHITTQTLSGSTEFGNTADDTHVFTGNITASGNISSSGRVFATHLKLNQDGAGNGTVSSIYFGSDPTLGGKIYDDGNGFVISYDDTDVLKVGEDTIEISNTLKVYGSGGDVMIGANAEPGEKLEVVGNISASGNILANEYRSNGEPLAFSGINGLVIGNSNTNPITIGRQGVTPIELSGLVTASGNISASGIVYADDYFVNNVSSLDNNGTELRLGYNTTHTKIVLGRTSTTTQVDITGNITASGNISSSGIINAQQLNLSNQYYADFNGTVFRVGVSAPTIHINDFDVNDGTGNSVFLDASSGNITSSGNISSSGYLYGSSATIASTIYLGGENRINYNNDDITLPDTGLAVIGGHITASGNISSSGTIVAQNFATPGKIYLGQNIINTGTDYIEYNNGGFFYKGRGDFHTDLEVGTTLLVNSHITASANISASGTITSAGLIVTKDTDGGDTVIQIANSNIDGGSDKGAGIEFQHGSANGSLSGNQKAGKILATKVSSYQGTTSNIDSNLEFYTANNDTDTLQLKIDNTGLAAFTGDISSSGDITADIANFRTINIEGANITYNSSEDILRFGDNVTLGIGTGPTSALSDTNLIHDGSNFWLRTITGNAKIDSYDGNIIFNPINSSKGVIISGSTTSTFLDVRGHITASGDISSSANLIISSISASGEIKGSSFKTTGLNITGNSINSISNGNIFFLVGSNGINFEADTGDSIIFNSAQNNVDVNMFGENDDKLFFLDASTDKIGIGTGTPTAKLHTVGNIYTTSHITASGNISASGTIFADTYKVDDYIALSNSGTDLNFGNANYWERFIYGRQGYNQHNFVGNITASGDISSSAASTASFGSLKVDGASVDFSGLPTSDPGVAGRLYNDSNVVKISAG